MSRAIVSFLTGPDRDAPEFLKHATDRWVHSLREWFPFSGDVILYVDDGVELPARLTNNVELRSLSPVYEASGAPDTFSTEKGNLYALKPFVLRDALMTGDYEMILMADVDALAVKPIDPVFSRCQRARKKNLIP